MKILSCEGEIENTVWYVIEYSMENRKLMCIYVWEYIKLTV